MADSFLADLDELSLNEPDIIEDAPNLCAIVGRDIAVRLRGIAGGLHTLATMPACNVQLLGAEENLTASSHLLAGYIAQTEVIQSTPPCLRMRACRLLAAKSTVAARVDSVRGDPSGKAGQRLLEEISKKIDKWQMNPPANQA